MSTVSSPEKLLKKSKVFVGMSGGVDSSVAAYLLKKQGYRVVGVFMRCYNLDGCAERDSEDARRVAEKLEIPFYVWDFEEDYKQKVVEYMIEGYRRGLTPNPDVECNREVKFGLFLKKALEMGADFVATGHYVQGTENKESGNYGLKTAVDKNKDQSYFLWTLTQEQLRHSLFPIGGLKKPQVREIARRAGLPTFNKKDSQGICFLGQVSIADFLKDYIKPKTGKVLTIEGKEIGTHEGAQFYTIGQRHGLNLQSKNRILGIKGVETKPHYVTAKDTETNTIVVAEGSDNPALYKKTVRLYGMNLMRALPENKDIEVMARVRYRQPLSPAILMISGDEAVLDFKQPQKFVAPGQSAVFYSSLREMLGGGVISQ
jgi:tRNA-specific 2-thiouridylase